MNSKAERPRTNELSSDKPPETTNRTDDRTEEKREEDETRKQQQSKRKEKPRQKTERRQKDKRQNKRKQNKKKNKQNKTDRQGGRVRPFERRAMLMRVGISLCTSVCNNDYKHKLITSMETRQHAIRKQQTCSSSNER